MTAATLHRPLREGDIIAPRNRLWHDVLIEEVRTDANGRLGTATVYEGGKLAPGPVLAWTAPPSDVALLPDWSDPDPAENERRTLHRLIGNAVVKAVSEGGEPRLPDVVTSVSAALGVAPEAVEDAGGPCLARPRRRLSLPIIHRRGRRSGGGPAAGPL